MKMGEYFPCKRVNSLLYIDWSDDKNVLKNRFVGIELQHWKVWKYDLLSLCSKMRCKM